METIGTLRTPKPDLNSLSGSRSREAMPSKPASGSYPATESEIDIPESSLIGL